MNLVQETKVLLVDNTNDDWILRLSSTFFSFLNSSIHHKHTRVEHLVWWWSGELIVRQGTI